VNTFSLLVQRKYAPSAHTDQLVKIQLKLRRVLKRTCRPRWVTARLKGISSSTQLEIIRGTYS